MAFDFHQYFDVYSAGANDDCVPEEEALRRIGVASGWLTEVGGRGFLSEFGLGRSPECLALLGSVLQALDDEPRWLGWTIWASAAWFGAYRFNLHPDTDPPQIAVLQPFLAE